MRTAIGHQGICGLLLLVRPCCSLVLVMVSDTLTWSAGTSEGYHAMVRRAPVAPVNDLLPSSRPWHEQW